MSDPKAALSDAIEGYFRALERDGYRPEGCSADDLADVLLALPGVAVIQLPEPDDDHGDGIAFWTDQEVGVADGMVVARFDPGNDAIHYEPTVAKTLGITLYAAAVLSERGAR